jgi:hypothetical protein
MTLDRSRDFVKGNASFHGNSIFCRQTELSRDDLDTEQFGVVITLKKRRFMRHMTSWLYSNTSASLTAFFRSCSEPR